MFGKLIHIPRLFPSCTAHLYFGPKAKEQSVHYNVPTACFAVKVREDETADYRRQGKSCFMLGVEPAMAISQED